jgi:hypothetical protein
MSRFHQNHRPNNSKHCATHTSICLKLLWSIISSEQESLVCAWWHLDRRKTWHSVFRMFIQSWVWLQGTTTCCQDMQRHWWDRDGQTVIQHISWTCVVADMKGLETGARASA